MQFGNFNRLKLEPPPPIRTLIKLAVEDEGDKVRESGMDQGQAVDVSKLSPNSDKACAGLPFMVWPIYHPSFMATENSGYVDGET